MEIFKKIYAPKGIIFDENFKQIYPTFFNVEKSKFEITEKMKLKQIANNRPKY